MNFLHESAYEEMFEIEKEFKMRFRDSMIIQLYSLMEYELRKHCEIDAYLKEDDNLKIVEFNNNIDFIKWNKKIEGKYKNVIELSNVLEIEIKRNKKNKTEVNWVYPK